MEIEFDPDKAVANPLNHLISHKVQQAHLASLPG
jgi:hypothetical protein